MSVENFLKILYAVVTSNGVWKISQKISNQIGAIFCLLCE